MDQSLDDLIRDRPRSAGRGSGGAARRDKPSHRSAPYERRGRGNFQYDRGGGRDSVHTTAGGGPGGGGGGAVVHVGNLSWHVDWRALKEYLSSAGDVTRVEIAKKDDGNSRGFATAWFATTRGARAAIATLHGCDFEGRQLKIEMKTGEVMPSGGKGGKGGGKGGGAFNGYHSQGQAGGY